MWAYRLLPRPPSRYYSPGNDGRRLSLSLALPVESLLRPLAAIRAVLPVTAALLHQTPHPTWSRICYHRPHGANRKTMGEMINCESLAKCMLIFGGNSGF